MNAKASTFVPGGGADAGDPAYYDDPHFRHGDDDDDDEEEMMDALEAEMRNDERDRRTVCPTSDTAQQVGVAVSAAPITATTTTSALPAHLAAHAADFWFPECRACACCHGYKHGCSCGGGLCRYCCLGDATGAAASGVSPPPQKKKPTSCRFFQQGTCKFGDKCRFSHSF